MLNNIPALTALWAFGLLANAQASTCPIGGDPSVVVNTGTPVGYEQVVDGVTMYISEPPSYVPVSDTAVLYLTNVYGLNLTENKLLVDSFARAGFLTVAPDLFGGQPSPLDMNDPSFNRTAFQQAHGPSATDPLVDLAISFMRTDRQVTRLALAGYCFGGRYAFRYADTRRTLRPDVVYAAHPSSYTDEEALAIDLPVSVAAADQDELLPAARRNQLEAIFLNGSYPYQMTLYSGVPHGFAVRANASDQEQVFGKETAFLQAVRWFTSF